MCAPVLRLRASAHVVKCHFYNSIKREVLSCLLSQIQKLRLTEIKKLAQVQIATVGNAQGNTQGLGLKPLLFPVG